MRRLEVQVLLRSCSKRWERLVFLKTIIVFSVLSKHGNSVSSSCAPDFYQSPVNKTKCLPCGANSVSPRGGQRDKCPCLAGYFRPSQQSKDYDKACEQPPGPPEQLKISRITSNSAFLSWEPPKETGTGDHVTYNAECISCTPVITYGKNLQSRNLSLSLVSATTYIVAVSSKNNVTTLLNREQSTEISFSTLKTKDDSTSNTWQWILLAFLIPTALIIFLMLLYQRLKLERAKRILQKAEDKERRRSQYDQQNDVTLQEIPRRKKEENAGRKTSAMSDGDGRSYINFPNPQDPQRNIKPEGEEGNGSVYVNIDRFEIPRGKLQFGRPLGEGFFGIVYMGTATGLPDEEGTVTVAIKTIKEDMVQFDEDFLHELQILRTLKYPHKNVVKLLACCTADGPSYIVLEYVETGDLWSYLKRNLTKSSGGEMLSTISLLVKLQICKMLAEGMEYLDQNNIIHRDLACRNILLNKELEPKISDFGLARKTGIDGIYCKGPKLAKLPLLWMAPESVLRGIYTSKSDVWSYGIVLWEIITNGERPYPGFQSDEMPTVFKSRYRMEQPEYCPDSMYSVMMACWEEEAVNRPTFTILKKLDLWTLGAPITV